MMAEEKRRGKRLAMVVCLAHRGSLVNRRQGQETDNENIAAKVRVIFVVTASRERLKRHDAVERGTLGGQVRFFPPQRTVQTARHCYT